MRMIIRTTMLMSTATITTIITIMIIRMIMTTRTIILTIMGIIITCTPRRLPPCTSPASTASG